MEEKQKKERTPLKYYELVEIIGQETAEEFLLNLEECIKQLKEQNVEIEKIRLEVWRYEWFEQIRKESENVSSLDNMTRNYLFNECLHDAMEGKGQSFALFCKKYGGKKNKTNDIYNITTIFISKNTIRNMHIYKDLKAGISIQKITEKYNISKSNAYRAAKKYRSAK